MKDLITNLLYFSFPEKKALVLFFTIVITIYGFNKGYNIMIPPKTFDMSLYEGLFLSENYQVQQDDDNKIDDHDEFTRVVSTKTAEGKIGGKSSVSAIQMPENISPQKENQAGIERVEKLPNKNLIPFKDSIIINKTKKSIQVEINTAEEYELQYVKGIGPSFASRIIKYRDLLGGFYKKEQLMEVYGLDQEMFGRIKDQIIVKGKVKKLPINLDEPPFFNHPYLTYLQAKIIRAYIIQHGPIKDTQDLLKIKIMNQETLEKIRPYLP
jgi:competence ComEA-like helix-hairpin-helix protein